MCITNFYESFHLLYNSICCRMLCYQFNGSLLRYQCKFYVCYTLHPRSKIQTCSSRGKLCVLLLQRIHSSSKITFVHLVFCLLNEVVIQLLQESIEFVAFVGRNLDTGQDLAEVYQSN